MHRSRLPVQTRYGSHATPVKMPPQSPSAKPVEVVAAVIQRPDGRFLLAQRPSGKVYAGYWEFPGGKVETAEPAASALVRELHEELGIDVTAACPWITREYVYPHAHVRLNFFRVLAWRGEPRSREAQSLSWQRLPAIDVAPVLPANGPVLRALSLPPVLAITDAQQRGEAALLGRLDCALSLGLRMVMVREKTLPAPHLHALSVEIARRCRAGGARVVINGDETLAQLIGADGVHLTSAQLAARVERPALPLCGASCHQERELERAAALGLDYVVLGPVRETPGHAGVPALGWERLARMVEGLPMPVYALGGMRLEDLDTACRAGAHGVAMIRGAWSAAGSAQSFPSVWSGSGSAVGMR